MSRVVTPLSPEQVRWRCDPALLGFATTAEIPAVESMAGQERGLEAIELGLNLDSGGYNIFVAGPPGTGRSTAVYGQIRRLTHTRPTPSDWVYLHNFLDPNEPIAVRLPPGRGPQLVRDLDQLITTCRLEIPRALEGERFEQQRLEVIQAVQARRDAEFGELSTAAQRLGFELQFTQGGIATIPFVTPGQPLSPEAFELLPDEKKAEIRNNGQQLQREIDDAMRSVRQIEREGQEQLRRLERDTALLAVGHLVETLRQNWADESPIIAHLTAIQADLLEHLDEFHTPQPTPGQPPTPLAVPPPSERYRANALVTHAPDSGPPIVFEPNPTYYNLLGRIDYRASMGTMQTNFTLISPGALHRANGGYLILQARDVLISPFSWEALKRSLRDREIRVENLGEQSTPIPTAGLKPQPIPLDVKVVLIGDPGTYMALYRMDDDFQKFFKVKAQFGDTMDRTPDAIQAYASFISNQVSACKLLPFASDAVARIVEEGARLAEHQRKLSTRFHIIAEVITEANYWAQGAGATTVTAAHVEQALAAQQRRLNLAEDEVQRMIDERTIAIDTTAAVVGQVNGLSVLDLGDYSFARPSRITARIGMGSDGVVNIEREVEMSGPSHSKGVLILSGYLLGAYARERPLALSARLTFEQVYNGVDGDSASSTELYALLSALAELPIKQGIAVTGSVNQRGEIQAVGGVTTKIEGFYAVCQAQGLTGEQGVIIPAANAQHLMLKQELVEAVAGGRFHVWIAHTVDEGIELLTDVPAGVRQADGTYPEGTVHARVQRRLTEMAEQLARYHQWSRSQSPGYSTPSSDGRDQ
jgi:lon-related putative ATP-dependent protease